MEALARYAGIMALLTFGVFAADVVMGAQFRTGFLSDLGGMLLLLVASTFFVILILAREALAKRKAPAPGDP